MDAHSPPVSVRVLRMLGPSSAVGVPPEAFPLFFTAQAVGAVTMVLLGCSLTVGNVIAMTMFQKLVPGTMLGRFSGASQTASSGLAPLGALAGGAIAEALSISAQYVIVAAVLCVAFLYPMSVVRQRDVDSLVIAES